MQAFSLLSTRRSLAKQEEGQILRPPKSGRPGKKSFQFAGQEEKEEEEEDSASDRLAGSQSRRGEGGANFDSLLFSPQSSTDGRTEEEARMSLSLSSTLIIQGRTFA